MKILLSKKYCNKSQNAYYITMKETIQEEYIPIVNIYATNREIPNT